MDNRFAEEEMKAFHQAMGSKGGKAATANLSKEQRSAIGFRLAEARAAKKLREKEVKPQALVDEAFEDMMSINVEHLSI